MVSLCEPLLAGAAKEDSVAPSVDRQLSLAQQCSVKLRVVLGVVWFPLGLAGSSRLGSPSGLRALGVLGPPPAFYIFENFFNAVIAIHLHRILI